MKLVMKIILLELCGRLDVMGPFFDNDFIRIEEDNFSLFEFIFLRILKTSYNDLYRS